MQRLSQRLLAAVLAVLGVGGLASAQSPAPNQLPVIPVAPIAAQPQAIPYQGGLTGTYPSAQVAVPAQMPSYQQVQQAQALPQPQPTQGSFPYGQTTAKPIPPSIATGTPVPIPNAPARPFGAYGAPPQPTNTANGVGNAPVPYNEYCPQCANGCGSYKSDLGFIFGSCKSFFNPCGPIPCNGCGGGSGCKKCGTQPFGKPYSYGYNTCVYDSYLNH